MLDESLRLDRLDVEHFIGAAEAVAFVQASSGFGGVQRDDANLAAARLSKGKLDELAGELFPAVVRLHINIQQVAALGGAGIERVRRPVEKHESGSGDHAAVVAGEPADVFAVCDGLGDPGFKVAGHDVEHLIIRAPGVDKHAPAMMGDKAGVCRGCRSGFQHGQKYSRDSDQDLQL